MAAKSDRRGDIQALLKAVELTPERWLETALQQPEISTVQLFPTVGGGYQVSGRIDTFDRGFDPEAIEAHVLAKHGPGRYCFRPIFGGEYLTNKYFVFGVLPPVTETVGVHGSQGGGVDAALDEATKTLKAIASQNQLKGIIADQQAGEMQREMLPLKMMGEVLSAHSKALNDVMQAKAAGGAGDSKMTEILLAQLASMQQMVFRLLEKPAAPERPALSEMGEQVKAIAEMARLLGFERGDGLPVAVPEKSFWTPEGIATMFEAARPFIQDVRDTVIGMAAGRGAGPVPGAAIVATGNAGPERAGAGGGGRMGLELEDDDKELLGVGIEALRSRDFPTVRVVLTELVSQYRIPFDTKANPEVYVVMLKRLAPEIVNLRAEFKDFFRWMEEEAARAAPKEMMDVEA